MRLNPTVDLVLIGQAQKLVQNHSARHRSHAHIVFGDLPAHAMHKGLHRVLGRRIDRLPRDRLTASNRRGEDDVSRAAGHHARPHRVDRATH